MAPRFSRRFNEPFPLPDSWSSYQRLRDFLDTFWRSRNLRDPEQWRFHREEKNRRLARAGPIRVGNEALSFRFPTLAPKVGNFLFWLSVESRRTEGRARSEQAQFRRIFSRIFFENFSKKKSTLWRRRILFLIRHSDSLFDSKP